MIERKPNRRGFGLLEVLASMAIGGIVMVSSNKMVSNQLSAQRNLAVKANYNNTVLQLNQYLSYQNNCTSSLLPPNFPIVTDPSGAPTNISQITQIPYSGNPVVGVGTVASDFSIDSLSLEFNGAQPTGSAPNSFLAKLVIRGTKTGVSTGSSTVYTTVPLYVQLSPASNQKRTFISCAVSEINCPTGKFYQSTAAGCVAPVELLTNDPTTPFLGEMWLRTDLAQ